MPTPDKLPGIKSNRITPEDILIVNDGGTTKKITLRQLENFFGTVTGSATIETFVFTSTTDASGDAGQPGATDTYTLTWIGDDQATHTADLEVYNGANGANGQDGAAGRPVDNVQIVGSPNVGDYTTLRFFVNGQQIGNDIPVAPGQKGETGDGFTGGSYDPATGIVTFTSDDSIGFSTGDLRGADSEVQGPQGAYYVKIFRRSSADLNGQSVPNTVTFSAMAGVVDTAGNWSETVPAGTDQLWEAELLYNPDGDQVGDWSVIFHAGATGPAGQRGESLEVSGYTLVGGANPGTTVNIQTSETDQPAGQFFVEKGDEGVRGPQGIDGTPGQGIENVVVDTVGTPGGVTQIHFEAPLGTQVGPIVTIPSGSVGAQGQQGVPGESIEVGGTSVDGAGNTTVVLEGVTSGTDRGSFLVNRGLQGDQGIQGPGYNDITDNGTDASGTAITFVGANGAADENLTIPRGAQGHQGVYRVEVFQVHGDTAPARPVGGTWDAASRTFGVLPAGWVAEPALDTTGTHVWESFAIFDPVNPTATLNWSEPFIAGSQGPTGDRGIHGTNVTATLVGTNLTVTETEFDGTGPLPPVHIVDNVNIVGPQGPRGFAVDNVTQLPQIPVPGTNTEVTFHVMGTPVTGTITLPPGNDGVGVAAGFGNVTAVPVPPIDPTTLGIPTITSSGPDTAKNFVIGIPTGLQGPAGNVYNFPNMETIAGIGNVAFELDGLNLTAMVDLTGYTPLNPSGGSGTTTDPAYRGVQGDAPTAFAANGTLTEVTGENAHDGQDFRYVYNDISGDGSDDWAVINLPNDLTDGHTVRWNFRDPVSGQIVLVTDAQVFVDTTPGATYTTYTMSFGSTVDIITHIS